MRPTTALRADEGGTDGVWTNREKHTRAVSHKHTRSASEVVSDDAVPVADGGEVFPIQQNPPRPIYSCRGPGTFNRTKRSTPTPRVGTAAQGYFERTKPSRISQAAGGATGAAVGHERTVCPGRRWHLSEVAPTKLVAKRDAPQ
ncbi:hypothetical protein C8035_v006622 [Colletotrichum spinosum]|uniref:Uncharacterized protein n=1 Tax=Colletotrichum spinosum TaxID=1347390 RepID=A0A4R8QNI0_9PEZI|nr:hypothetical protein C8035_v006622 [Colletotrichum spinosum]